MRISMPTQRLSGDEEVDIPAIVNAGGVIGLLGLTYWMFVTGRLYTGAQHREIVEDKDAQIERLVKSNEVKDVQIDKLSVVGEAFIKIMASVEELGRRRQR